MLRQQLEIAALALRPLLNRVVFSGRHAAAFLESQDAATHPRTVPFTDREVRVLSSMSLERVATEMKRLGFSRTARTAVSDVWAIEARVAVDVRFVQADSASATPWLEYATLLTVPAVLTDGTTARLSSAPALLGLLWAARVHEGIHPLESGHIEDIIRLTAAHATIERELASSPLELRRFVSTESARLLADDSAPHAIRCALPEGRDFPEATQRVFERLRRIAALG